MSDSDEYLKAIVNYYTSVERPYQGIAFPDITFIDVDPARVLSAGARTLIVGPPGSGKTTFLDWTALHAASAGLAIPIFCSLRNYVSSLRHLLDVSVERFLDGGSITRLQAGTTDRIPMAFLFDGLDEVLPSNRDEVENSILALAAAYPQSPMIVTSRYRPPSHAFGSWAIRVVQDLTQAQVADYLSAIPEGDELSRLIEEDPRLMALAVKPAFLHTIRHAFASRVDVRDYLMREIPRYAAWRGHSKSLLPSSITPSAIDGLLESIALYLAIRGELRLSLGKLTELTRLAPDAGQAVDAADAVLATDTIVFESPEYVRFSHLSLFESYAARALVRAMRSENSIDTTIQAILSTQFSVGIANFFITLITETELQALPRRLSAGSLSRLVDAGRNALADRSAYERAPSGRVEPPNPARIAAAVVHFAQRQEDERKDILVIALHGFNTRGDWKNRLGLILTRATDGERFIYRAWDYGGFRLRILNPFARQKQVASFHDFFNQLLSTFATRPEVVVVAHSFGSYILGHALRRFPEIYVDRLLLLGSALPRRFDWKATDGRCGNVLNIIGGDDAALMAARLIPGLGDGGRSGFTVVPESFIQTRENSSRHSDLFGDLYMTNTWLPFLRDGSVTDRRKRGTAA